MKSHPSAVGDHVQLTRGSDDEGAQRRTAKLHLHGWIVMLLRETLLALELIPDVDRAIVGVSNVFELGRVGDFVKSHRLHP